MNTSCIKALLAGLLLVALCCQSSFAQGGGPPADKGGGGGHTETLGNNLSFPVIFSDGVTKTLRGEFGVTNFPMEDAWYIYGDGETCDSRAEPGSELVCPDPLPEDAVAVFPQQSISEWQAESVVNTEPLAIHKIDWGDNLESVDWYTRSQVRIEHVLIQELAEPMVEFEMVHLFGWGIDELHGTTGNVLPGMQATLYTDFARLTIQQLLVDRDDPRLAYLEWDPLEHKFVEAADYEGEPLISEPLLNKAVHEAGDGPGYYSAEINVKGKIIFGYTWNAREFDAEPADYRITFSLDAVHPNPAVSLMTFMTDPVTGAPVTEIVPMSEEESVESVVDLFDSGEPFALESEDGTGGGGTAVIEHENNLTYMDVRILERGGGGGGGGGKGGGGGGPRRR